MTKTAGAMGTFAGFCIASKPTYHRAGFVKNLIKDPLGLGRRLFEIGVSEFYGDRRRTMVYGAQAIGEQLGTYMLSNQWEGKMLGSVCGAAFFAHRTDDTKLRDQLLKIVAINAVTIPAVDKIHSDRTPPYQQSKFAMLVQHGVDTQIAHSLFGKIA